MCSVCSNLVHSELVAANKELSKSMSALSNIRLHGITVTDFKRILHDKLGIDHPIQHTSEAWARKLPDMKMLAALLFGEFIAPRHRFWGFCDLDVVWGNVSRFAHWFQGDFPVVKTSPVAHGPAHFFAKKKSLIRLYLNEKYVNTTLYLSLLKQELYYNFDEIGKFTSDISNSRYSLDEVLNKYLNNNHFRWNGYGAGLEELKHRENPRGGDPIENGHPHGVVFVDEHMALHIKSSMGPVTWMQGTLKIVFATDLYPAGREIMMFHRPRMQIFETKLKSEIKRDIIDDMIIHGYLLPIWSPIFTRHATHFENARARDAGVQMRFKHQACNFTEDGRYANFQAALVTWKKLICAKMDG